MVSPCHKILPAHDFMSNLSAGVSNKDRISIDSTLTMLPGTADPIKEVLSDPGSSELIDSEVAVSRRDTTYSSLSMRAWTPSFTTPTR
jgi:hypothetical protein